MKFAGLLMMFFALSGAASAAVNAPEIDGGFFVSGVTLALGGLMIARGRRRK